MSGTFNGNGSGGEFSGLYGYQPGGTYPGVQGFNGLNGKNGPKAMKPGSSDLKRPHFVSPIETRRRARSAEGKEKSEEQKKRKELEQDVGDPDQMLFHTVQQAVRKRPKGDHSFNNHHTPVAPDDEQDIRSLTNAEDTISFLSSKTSSSTSVKFVYLNRAETRLGFRPYDLEVVMRGEQEPEHFVISATGVVHVEPAQPSEVMTLSEWMRESTLFNVLTRIKFFKHYLIGKAFTQWRRNVRFKMFSLTRKKLCKTFFLSKNTFAATMMDLHKHAYDLSTFSMMHVPDVKTEYLMEKFKEDQALQRAAAGQEYISAVDKMETKLLKLCDSVTQRANVPDLTTMESLEQYLLANASISNGKDRGKAGKKMKSMVEAQQEQRERMRQLKRAMVEHDMLGDFIRLVDYIAAEHLFKNCVMTIRSFLGLLQLPQERKMIQFQITISFAGDEGLAFVPSERDVLDTYNQWCEDMVQQVSQVTRLIYLKTLKVHFAQQPKTFTVGNAIRNDHRYNGHRHETHELIAESFRSAFIYGKTYETHRLWFVFVDEEWPIEYQRWEELDFTEITHLDFTKYIKKIRTSFAELEKMFNKVFGVLFLNSQKLRNELMPRMQDILTTIHAKLIDVARKKTQKLFTDFTSKVRTLQDRPTILKNFAAFVQSVNGIKAELPKLMSDAEEIELLYQISEENNVDMPQEDTVNKEMVVGGPQQSGECLRETFLHHIEEAGEFKTNNLKVMSAQLDLSIDHINEELLATMAILNNGDYVTPSSDCREVLAQLSGVSESIDVIKEKVETYADYQKLFEIPVSEWTNLQAIEKLYKQRFEIWSTLDKWQEKKHHWGTTPLDQLDVEVMRDEVNDFYKKAFSLHKEAKDDVTEYLLECVKEEKQYMPVILDLGNKNLRKEHWAKIFAGMQKPFAPDTSYTLDGLRAWKVFDYKQLVEEQSAIATGEANLQGTLDKIKSIWDEVEFETQTFRDNKDTFIIGGVEEILQTLEDNQVTLQTCLASRFVAGIRPRVEEWDRRLQVMWEVIDEWVNCQKTWMYLEFIFSSDDIKRQLPEESRKFAQVDRDFRDLTKKAHTNKTVLHVCCEEGVLDTLREDNLALDEVQKRLEDYLETKRSSFPRFYFLSNDELLAILSDVRNPQNVQPHLIKCFDNMKELTFKEDSLYEILGMCSGEAEKVPFSSMVYAKGNVESWLCQIEAMMRQTLLDQMRAAQRAFYTTPRVQWYWDFPAQCILVIDQTMWTTDTEAALNKVATNPLALEEFHGLYSTQLEETVNLVRGFLTKLQRRCVGTLIVVGVHSRDVIQTLVEANCDSPQAFEWNMQLRYYWEKDLMNIRQTSASFIYGCEYLGNSPRLVITSLTDRAYLTCTGALHYNLGAAPQGPAGTGKTESVKDLGKALARQCVVFNCSDGLDYSMMARMFSGLAQAGAWACFDEFNRIGAEVLSVIAQQMLAVTTAIAAKATSLFFEGREISLNHDFGVFITMNPGYAGRQELPDNLKALFRPVCLMVPDYGLIAEIMFYSEGFRNARVLAQKMQQLYRLSSEQLSKQDHYDFGMRAVKSILVMAGSLKRAEPDLSEDMLLIRAMRDSNIPKFLRDDAVLFMALISDLFPSVEIVDALNPHLEETIRKDLIDNNYEAYPDFVLKVLQFQETMVVRHGVMLVGQTMCGKTVCSESLQRCLKTLLDDPEVDPEHENAFYNQVIPYVMNPKSVTMGELYGEANEITREWTDGILSNLARKAVRDTSGDRSWIIFDGPVDALWIENMNTVLDDNKMLCLVNGERIKIPDSVTFCFEVQDLRVASPATVSRCGMVFLEPWNVDGGWRCLAKRTNRAIAERYPDKWFKDSLWEILDNNCDNLLKFIRSKTREYITTCDAQLVESMFVLLESFIKNLDEEDDEPKEAVKPKEPKVKKSEDDDDDDMEEAEKQEEEAEPEPEEEEVDDEPKLDLPPVETDFKKIFDMYVCLSLVWSLAGNVIGEDRAKCHSVLLPLIKKLSPDFPDEQSVYDWCVHKKSMKFVPWSYKIDKFIFSRSVPYFSILVPTAETTIFASFLRNLMSVGRNVIINGPTGVGKSQVISNFILSELRSDSPDSAYASFDITFSAQTSSKNLQEKMESKLHKKKGMTVLGGPPGKKLVFFVDDINMPALEEYGASPPVELLRQVIDQKGFYDRQKIFWKEIQDLTCIASCGPPGGGKNELTQRITSKFHALCFPTLGEQSLLRIFRTILHGFLAIFAKDVRQLAYPVVDATVEVYNTLFAEMRPTPSRSHYTFNMRDLSKVVQGMLMVTPQDISEPVQLVRLWTHEASRVFHDRLIDDKDRGWWWGLMKKMVTKSFNMEWSAEYEQIIFCDFLDKGGDGPGPYKEAPSIAKIQDAMSEFMVAYNVNFNKEDDLVFFDDAIQHLSRICRVLRQPRGNALLVGVGGSGRQSLTHMAAFMADMKLMKIQVTRGYGIAEFREDLKKVLLDAGCDDKPLVFLVNDTQIAKEQFLEDINNVLNSGEVPNLIQSEDLERIMSSVAPKVKAAGKEETRDVILSHFVYLCRENLHVVLVMSPIGDKFRTRLRMFPSLVNCMTIDWYKLWPRKALLSVAERFFNKVEFENDETRGKVSEMCVVIHQAVQDASETFYDELRRRNYTTPTSYLELINSYLGMLDEQGTAIENNIKRYQGGLDKLAETEVMVDQMKKDLGAMQPVLDQAAKDTAAMMVVLEKDQKIAAEARIVCTKDEKETQIVMDEAAAIKNDCQKDLDKAMPAFFASVEALKSLNKKDIDEIKSFTTPPEKVKLTLDAVMLLLKEKPGWDTAKKAMGSSDFISRLQNYDKDNIAEPLLKKLQKWINDELFQPDIIKATSAACMSLCLWVRAMDNYAKVAKTVEPKKAKLKVAEDKLSVATKKLQEKQKELADVEAKVRRLKESYEESVQKGKNLEAEMKTTEVRLERAGKLLGGLSSEKVRWETSVKTLTGEKKNLVGNMMLAAGGIAYLGPFTAKYRAKLMEGWTTQAAELKIPVDEGFKIESLTEQVMIRTWGIKGLPMDGVSIENGTIQSRARRWALMIDPQGQANQWIKNMERDKGLKVVKMSEPNLLRTLENCIRVGIPVLLENVGETLDPALDPILQKQVFRQGGRLLLRLGDTDVDYDQNFKFFITTKLPNPHYMPELQIRTTIINFTVTPKGLEDQLLVDVVRYERAELEVQKDKLVVQIADGAAQLKSLEDKILSLLASAGADILDNEVLINTLAQSKKTSEEINKDLEVAEKTSIEIDQAREGYRSVANRGSLIYTVIAGVGELEHMYQVSLQFYKKLFNQTLERTERSDILETRIESLISAITMNSYVVICRGLFERDKLLYAFLMAVEILRYEGVIKDSSWDFFLRGSGKKPDGSAHPQWMPEQLWAEVLYLSTMPGFDGLADCMKTDSTKWEMWYIDDNPHLLTVPSDLTLSSWEKLMLLKTMRPEKVLLVVQQMVASYLGSSFTESPPFDLDGAFEDTSPLTPMIFVLSSGSDPTVIFLNFAQEKGFHDRKKMLSLGQDQGPKAEDMIANGIKVGEWIYLQNCHLCASWMPGLEKVMEDLQQKELHPEFRLWLTSMPSLVFPVAVLQSGMKLVKEPPKGLKANLRDTFSGVVSEKVWEETSKSYEWKKLVFSLVFFHGIIQERRKFGPLGWNIAYEWNNSDLSAGTKYLHTYLEDFEIIPWAALRYILGTIVYGGRVTDFLDLRCVGVVLDKFVEPGSLEEECTFTADGIYYPPSPGDLPGIFEYLSGLPQHENPEVFGLHANADITVQKAESRAMLDSVVAIQPKGGGGGGGGKGPDAVVDAIAEDYLAKLVEPVSKEDAHPEIFKLTGQGIIPSLSTVLVQEVDRFNNLLRVIKSTLRELRRAIAGEVILSSDLEKMFNDFLYARVPGLWTKVGYPSLKPLGSWYNDFLERVEFLRAWMQGGNPHSFWISGFFFPQGFLTGVLQTHSRRFQIPIDELRFKTNLLTVDVEDVEEGPDIGVHIHGFFLEGARWDRANSTLTESSKNVLYQSMPVVHLECVHKDDEISNADELYACPFYKTSTRAGTLSTTGLSTNHVMNLDLPSLHNDPNHWIMRGAALLSMLND